MRVSGHAGGEPGVRRARVLVADDDEAVLRMAGQILAGEGFDVVAVENGRAALSAVEAGGIDLAIVDLVMPEVDGIEFIKTLRDRGSAVPIIAISGAFGGHFLRVARAMGAREAILKPFSAEDLAGSVKRVLQPK
jgi:CheY-like chemotaxis protein